MELNQQLVGYKEFVERYYIEKLLHNINLDKKYLNIDYNDIAMFDPELAENLLCNPEDSLQTITIAIEAINDTYENIKPRIFNLPKSCQLGIGEVRKEHFDKFWQFEGTVIKLGDEMAALHSTKYSCPSCGITFNILQTREDELKSPHCGCGRKSGFTEVEGGKIWKDVMHIIVEEHITDYTTKKARPTTIKVVLEHDLAKESIIKKLQPGKHVRLTGIVQSTQIQKSTFFKFRILCNYIEVEDVSLFNMKIPEKYISQFKQLKEDKKLITDLAESVFHGIEGLETEKEILTVSRARGVKSYHQDGRLDQRDTINVLLISNPGASKSHLGKNAVSIDPISMTVSGKGVSGVGLTATTVYDKDLQSWCVISGAVPRCDKGSIFIDEGDKIEDNNTAHLNEGMVNLSFMTVKAGQQVTLSMDTNIIMAVNPEGRKFERTIDKHRQITLKPDFMDRFDIWVAIKKGTEPIKQKQIIGRIVGRFNDDPSSKVGKYDLKFVQYYYAWIIQNFKPKINEEIKSYATQQIFQLMNKVRKEDNDGNNESSNDDVSYRIVENIIRFAIARDKILQRNEVTKESIDKSIEYQKYGFTSLDMMKEDGRIDVEKIQHEEPSQIKRKKYEMEDLIKEMFELLDPSEKYAGVSTDEVMNRWTKEGNEVHSGEEWITRLLREGRVFEPKSGFLRPI